MNYKMFVLYDYNLHIIKRCGIMTAKTLQTAPLGQDQTYSLDFHGGKVL